MKFTYSIFLVLILTACQNNEKAPAKETLNKLPNFVVIMADDLGYADLGCFDGALGYATPKLDKMAAEGLKLTSLYSANPVCSPSRAGLLTGRDPKRMGINGVFFPNSWTGMDPSEITLAEQLKQKGYATAIVGKWHLGHHYKYLPLQQGFDEYFGIPYSNDMSGVVYMKDNEVVEQQVDQRLITKTYTEKSLDFIERHQDQPFFLYVPHSMPHVPIYASEDFEGKTERGLYGDVIEEIDWSTGEILKKLETLGIAEHTVVIFTSDNGPWLPFGPEGGSADPLREGKQFTFEGGMRVPGIVQWKGTIKAGSIHDGMVSFLDVFPTFSKLAGIDLPLDRAFDGVDINNVLMGEGSRNKDEILYSMGEDFRAFRKGDWKIKMPFAGTKGSLSYAKVAAHDTLLFNLREDIGELNDLSQTNPEKRREMVSAMEAAIAEMGELPPSLIVRPKTDRSHIKKNKERLGID